MRTAAPSFGVLVMAHGTPARPEDIAPFYTRIRRGRPPSPEQLADLERRYDAIGGTSPLNERTAAQVAGLDRVLQARAPGRFTVAFGAKHTEPLIEDAAAQLGRACPAGVIGLVLTPHGSSVGSAEYMARAVAAIGTTARFEPVSPWFDNPGFVSLLAQRVTAALAAFALADQARLPVLFTAHSAPARVREEGDTYPDQLEASARLVAAAAGLTRWEVAWQSAGRTPEPWLGPDVGEVVRRLGSEAGVDGVIVCPIGFVADHLEVLYDIDVELAAIAQASGLRLVRTASLNDDPSFLDVLADVVCASAARLD